MSAAPAPEEASSYYDEGDWGPPGPALGPGEHLAPGYRVISLLRRGNRLDVYDLWSEERDCRCIGKTLRPERAADPTAAERLREEGALLGSLTHPNLVRGYETLLSGEPERPAVITETLPGATLSHLLDEHERLRPVDAAILGVQLCSALGYLHRKGWAHLDVKPSNVISTGGRAVLLDLSLACRIGERSSAGTFDYLSPEQARGGEMTAATDVWGLGITLWEALSGDPPWAEHSHHRGADGVRHYPQLTSAPPPLRTRRRLPARLSRTVDACLAPDPGARPTITEVADRLITWSGVDPAA